MSYDIIVKRKYADTTNTYKNDQDDRSLSLKKIANCHDIGTQHKEKRNIYRLTLRYSVHNIDNECGYSIIHIFFFYYTRYNIIDFRISFNKKFVSMNVKTNDFQTLFIIKRNCRRYLTILYYTRTLCIRIEFN